MSKQSARKFQFVFVHDHTASMGGLRVQVRRENCRTINELYSSIQADLEVGAIAICDRHDVPGERDMKEVVLTADKDAVIRHFQTVPDALGNSSWEECYERALHRLRDYPWDPRAIKVVVFTGDSQPHPINHPKNPERFDWRVEAKKLVEECGVSIYPVYALTFYEQGGTFWKDLAEIGGGVLLKLDQFDHITPFLLGIAARAGGAFQSWEEAYVRQTSAAGCSIPYAVQRGMDLLAGRKARGFSSRNAGKTVAVDGRFQVYTIEEKTPAAEFFRDLGIIERLEDYGKHKGELFYAHESRSRELIRPQHEVIIEDDATGEKLFGRDARAEVGIPYGTKDQYLSKNALKSRGYTIWIQSKSVGNSRHLEAGQRVMIDLSPNSGFGR